MRKITGKIPTFFLEKNQDKFDHRLYGNKVAGKHGETYGPCFKVGKIFSETWDIKMTKKSLFSYAFLSSFSKIPILQPEMIQ